MRLLEVLARLTRPTDRAEPSMSNKDLRDRLSEAQSEVDRLHRDYIALSRRMIDLD